VRPNLRMACQKTKLCVFFARGDCTNAEACRFAHGPDELRALPDLNRIKLCPSIHTGRCPRGVSCTFAHNEAELRSLDEHCLDSSHPGRNAGRVVDTQVPAASDEIATCRGSPPRLRAQSKAEPLPSEMALHLVAETSSASPGGVDAMSGAPAGNSVSLLKDADACSQCSTDDTGSDGVSSSSGCQSPRAFDASEAVEAFSACMPAHGAYLRPRLAALASDGARSPLQAAGVEVVVRNTFLHFNLLDSSAG